MVGLCLDGVFSLCLDGVLGLCLDGALGLNEICVTVSCALYEYFAAQSPPRHMDPFPAPKDEGKSRICFLRNCTCHECAIALPLIFTYTTIVYFSTKCANIVLKVRD